MTKNTKTVIILLVIAALIAIVPLFALKGAEFGGSDDAGSEMISEIQGKDMNHGSHQYLKLHSVENFQEKSKA